MKLHYFLLAAGLSLWHTAMFAGDEPKLWTQYYQDLKLGGNWHLMSDGGLRSTETFGKFDFFQVRSGLSYDIIPEKLSMEAGAWHSQDFAANKKEWRPHYQFQYVKKTPHLRINLRLRMEERLVKTEESGTQKSWRPRFLVGLRIPIAHPKKDIEKKNGLWLGHEQEILWRSNASDGTNFNQYRLIQGLGWTFNKHLELSANYFLMFGEEQQGLWMRLRLKL